MKLNEEQKQTVKELKQALSNGIISWEDVEFYLRLNEVMKSAKIPIDQKMNQKRGNFREVSE